MRYPVRRVAPPYASMDGFSGMARAPCRRRGPLPQGARRDLWGWALAHWRRWTVRGAGEAGNTSVELAMVLPALMLVILGTIKFGVALNAQVALNNGVAAAARYMAVCRAECAASGAGPWTGAQAALDGAAPNLNAATLNASMSATLKNSAGTSDGTCTSDTTCAAALTADGNSASGAGGHVAVSATYPCDLKVMGVNFAPGCVISAKTVAIIE